MQWCFYCKTTSAIITCHSPSFMFLQSQLKDLFFFLLIQLKVWISSELRRSLTARRFCFFLHSCLIRHESKQIRSFTVFAHVQLHVIRSDVLLLLWPTVSTHSVSHWLLLLFVFCLFTETFKMENNLDYQLKHKHKSAPCFFLFVWLHMIMLRRYWLRLRNEF